MSARFDRSALDVVSAAYRMDVVENDAWLREILRAATPALDQGLGVMAWCFRVTPQGAYGFASPIVATDSIPEEVVQACMAFNEALPAEVVTYSHAPPRAVDTASRAVDGLLDVPFEEWPGFEVPRSFGHHDNLGVRASDPTGYGFVLAAPLPRIERVADDSRWHKVMAHVLAGLRLREGLGREAEGDAVLDPGGRVLHAEGEARASSAREALRAAATIIDQARASRGRADPERALRLWKGLVAGRWSLVDRFDADGRRFLIARRNEPAVAGPPVLTERERQVLAYAALGFSNEHTAYAMGLAPSTVSSHLRSGMRRVGARDRADLAAVFAPPPAPRSSDG